jgi:hypothetical protein
MPECGGANIEVAHKLNEGQEGEARRKSQWIERLEIVEAVVLATVAIATAWSGYQSARWDGLQDELYEKSTRLRVESQGLQTRSGQEQAYNASVAAEWIKAKAAGNEKIAALFERRVLPEFRPAFEAWKDTDPLNNPSAPPGPMMMPQYRNTAAEEATKKAEESAKIFEEGAWARATSDKYVRATVLLATVLLLTAISQRFRTRAVRMALVILALLLLCFPIYRLITLPHLW